MSTMCTSHRPMNAPRARRAFSTARVMRPADSTAMTCPPLREQRSRTAENWATVGGVTLMLERDLKVRR